MPPSQFAAFVAQEIHKDCLILDVGCGNGRDSLFFAFQGFEVIGIDASEQALKVSRDLVEEKKLTHVQFLEMNIQEEQFGDLLIKYSGKRKCVYARFLLHAITEDEQDALLNDLQSGLQAGDVIAFEYRTLDDADLGKEALPHYRRYQTSKSLNAKLASLGFEEDYTVEGRGFAKFKSEDAIVARCVFKKAS